jgi:hypothetical protein
VGAVRGSVASGGFLEPAGFAGAIDDCVRLTGPGAGEPRWATAAGERGFGGSLAGAHSAARGTSIGKRDTGPGGLPSFRTPN